MRREPAEFYNTNSTVYQESFNLDTLISYWWHLFSKWYDALSETSTLGTASRKIPGLIGLSMLESQRHDRGVCKHTLFYTHNLVDQRSGDSNLNSRSHDSLLKGAETSPDFDVLGAKIASALKKIISTVHFRRRVSVDEQRAQKIRPILMSKTDCLHDL